MAFCESGACAGALVRKITEIVRKITETEFTDLELSSEFGIDLISEQGLVKLGLSLDEINDVRKVAKLMEKMPDSEVVISNTVVSSVGVIKDTVGIGDNKPKAIVVTYDFGLQLFAGVFLTCAITVR